MVGDISVVVFNDVGSAVFSGANCSQEQRVFMSLSLNAGAEC